MKFHIGRNDACQNITSIGDVQEVSLPADLLLAMEGKSIRNT